MAYDLCFSGSFFTDETFPYDTPTSKRPTTVYQAIISLPLATQIGIARDVLKSKHPYLYVRSESFACDVLDKIRETNTCDSLSSPIEVYIDSDGYYSVTVYDERES